VSGFGENGRGDTGDNWEVVCVENGPLTNWTKSTLIKFKHTDTSKLLTSPKKFQFNTQNCGFYYLFLQVDVMVDV